MGKRSFERESDESMYKRTMMNDEVFYKVFKSDLDVVNLFLRVCLSDKSISTISSRPRSEDPALRYNPVIFDIKAVDGLGRLMNIVVMKIGMDFCIEYTKNSVAGISEEELENL
ncbi:MAG: hypothetical protein IJ831_03215 [Spirochaetales bacterium]|nr:hypothetical protein [Spirochaetales bacterium]